MIDLKNITKIFKVDNNEVLAVNDVSLHIPKGSIYGIIGFSGAGKSTLVRCINLLERPNVGEVWVDDINLTNLSAKELRKRRKKIGMIFQHFNLFSSQTVFNNVAFGLRYQKLDKETINQRVNELLELVGITDKKDAYPSQLSGGQKQRVAIARALANDPDILLCDEATSALDPQTTSTILKLLYDLNKKLNLTIVIITHEMKVVKEICDQVAVMEKGKIVEQGDIISIFTQPEAEVTQNFINTTTNFEKVEMLLNDSLINLDTNDTLLHLTFKGPNTKDAIISKMSNHFEMEASIIYANIEIVKEEIIGNMVVILKGKRQKEVYEYLESLEIQYEIMKGDSK